MTDIVIDMPEFSADVSSSFQSINEPPKQYAQSSIIEPPFNEVSLIGELNEEPFICDLLDEPPKLEQWPVEMGVGEDVVNTQHENTASAPPSDYHEYQLISNKFRTERKRYIIVDSQKYSTYQGSLICEVMSIMRKRNLISNINTVVIYANWGWASPNPVMYVIEKRANDFFGPRSWSSGYSNTVMVESTRANFRLFENALKKDDGIGLITRYL
jgi:hypothetical protein